VPWRVKRELYLILIGCGLIAAGAIVAYRNRSVDLRLLGFVGIGSGLGMILNALPGGNGS
jgi:ABC-type Fe3+-siderophore transport system permease subunit